ncbi:DUF3231 family protein [Pseudalkalibacillus caeni]|uniref:DUF3231 family protein n=1 Tax=Exobacillus caeni TaxID=2574798 RepID=A0A5R9F4A7_9BACL|nr:DUF3231 family protein [Pseudalkalibacillus caeni]TLS37230.1 DUF3231 family protein [Pseudalkalibacillus caeni]
MVTNAPKLTSAEIAMIWNTYMGDTMAICVLKHFLNTTEDKDVEPILRYALELSEQHIQVIKSLLSIEKLPIPHGFNEDDVDLEAPKLFSDVSYLRYIHHMGRSGLSSYSLARAVAARKDTRKIFHHFLRDAEKLFDKNVEIMQEKGVFIRAPYIDYPGEIEYADDVKFLGEFLGKPRPLLAIEIAHLGTNIEVSNVAKTLFLGFSQVARSHEISDYFKKGYTVAKKHGEEFMTVLRDDDVSSPSTWDSTITDSTDAPFSDKLMLFQANILSAFGIGDYGLGMAASLRKDLAAMYARLLVDLGLFAEKGAKLMIKHGWFEKPPQSLDREKLRTMNKN